MLSKKITLSLLLLPFASAQAWENKFEPIELGGRSSVTQHEASIISEQPFISNKGALYYENEFSGLSFRYHFRLSHEFKQREETVFSPMELTANYQGENFLLSGGMQVVSFSETFGVNIMDVVNPRDYQLGILDDLEWSKLPVPLLSGKYLAEKWNLEFYLSPYSRSFKMASAGSAYDAYASLPLERKEQRPHPVEGGMRFNYLFENGLDLNLIYYHHLNRRPFYYLDGLVLKTSDEMLNSFGATYSYSFSEVVLRGDYLFTPNAPGTKADATLGHLDHHQLIVGADWASSWGYNFGIQVFHDSTQSSTWSAYQIQKMEGEWIPTLMLFYGLNNSDRWLRPELSYSGIQSWEFRLRADILQGKSGEGMISSLRQGDRIEFLAKYFY